MDIKDKHDLLEYFKSVEFDEDVGITREDKFQMILDLSGFSDVFYNMIESCIEAYDQHLTSEPRWPNDQ